MNDLGMADQGVVGRRRLVGEHVDGHRTQPALVQGGGCGCGVDQTSSGGVDDGGRGFHEGQPLAVDQVAGLIRQ